MTSTKTNKPAVVSSNAASTELFDLFDTQPSSVTTNVDDTETHFDGMEQNSGTATTALDNLDSMKELNDVFAQINQQNSIVSATSEILKPQQVITTTTGGGRSQSIKNDDRYDLGLSTEGSGNWLNGMAKNRKSTVRTDGTESSSSTKQQNLGTNQQSGKNIPDLDSLVTGMLHSSLNRQQSNTAVKDDETNLIADIEDEIMLDCMGGSGSGGDEPKSTVSETLVSTNCLVEKSTTNNGDDEVVVTTSKPVSKELKSLADIEIDLEKINPSKEEARIIMNDPSGLKIVLNFAEDHPRPDVSVIVVTVVNQDVERITKFQLDASVSKPCKLRLMNASGEQLPGVKPFRPPVENITQVLLYSNPKRTKTVKMVFILSYCIGDDPDPIRESIEVKDLPYLLNDNE